VTQYFNIHPENPQQRLLDQTADMLRQGAVVALPTDSCYSLACHLGDAAALDKIRKIRGIDDHHLMTLMCRDLSDIGQYARVDNAQYRLLKLATPGAYTFRSGRHQGAAAPYSAPQAQDPGAADSRQSHHAGRARSPGRAPANHHADAAR